MKDSDKREKIMQTALELFAEHGFHGVPMAMIAEKADIAIGTIYLYFENKDNLIKELYVEMEKSIIATIQKEDRVDKPVRERFLNLTKILIGYFISNPLHFRYFEQYINSPFGISMRRDEIVGKFRSKSIAFEIFEEAIAHKVLKDLPMHVLFSLGFGSLIFLIRDHILGFVKLDKRSINKITEACWDCIKR